MNLFEPGKNLKSLHASLTKLVEGKLWLKVIIALLLGVAFGIAISPNVGWVKEETAALIGNWFSLPGMLFLKLVQMIMIPLIFASIITGITSNNLAQLKKMGLGVTVYFVFTTIISITVGIAISLLFEPGKIIHDVAANDVVHFQHQSTQNSDLLSLQHIPNAISNLIPDNPLASMVTGEMLSIVIFTVIIGISILTLAPKTQKPITDLLHAVQEICMNIVKWAMRLVPIAVFGFMVQLSSTVGLDSVTGIGLYVLVVILALAILLVIYLIIISIIGKRNPIHFLRAITDVQLLAFSTTSSAAVMPLSLKTAEDKLNVSPTISNFVIPIGATVNMDGTAIYQCITTLFIAQAYGLELDLLSIVLVMVTIVAASIGTPAIPGGGVVILASVLQSVGIPAEGIVIIIGVERVLGMFRTAINVTGDLTACVIFDRLYGTESSNSSKPTLSASGN